MPRILRIINRLNLGGPTYNVAYLAKYLTPEYETLLVAGARDASEASSEHILQRLGLKEGVKHLPTMRRAIHPLNDRTAYRQIKEIIRQFKPDIVHTHAAKAGALGRLAAFREKVPVVVHTFHGHVFHSYFNPLKTALFRSAERYLAARSSAIIAISETQKHELTEIHRIAPAEKVHVVPLGFDLAPFQEDMAEKRTRYRAEARLAENEVAIGIVGRLVPVKDHRLFLEAFALLLKQTSVPVRAFIVGDGELREALELQARNLGIAFSSEFPPAEVRPLTFTSWSTEIDRVMAGMDIIALSSRNEGTPVSLIEAQAAGRPIVSTRTGGIADVVIEGSNALLSDAGKAESFAANLLRLVEDKPLRERMAAGSSHVFERFHFQRLVADMRNLYENLLNGEG